LSIVNGSSDLRPKRAQLASFGGGLYPAALREAVSGLGDPLLLSFCVSLAIRDYINICAAFRHNSTNFDNAKGCSTFFDTFRHHRSQQTWVGEHKV
jgi:hypothetical protein